MPDELLAELDWVVASLHTSLDRSPTERVLAAIDNPHVDCIGHLTGRRISRRPGADLDLDRVVARAVETRTALEINSQPDRLDMRDVHARLAGEAGVLIPIDTDAHSTGALGYAELGIGQARRAWLTKEQVLNTRSWAEIEKLQGVSTFREDGAAALEWVARYLEDVRELPGALAGRAGRDPGGAARRRRPRQAEPFAAVLRDLDEILMPGITHWQSPRYFAYFATTAAEPGILAELLIAGLNQVGILWRASPALQELEEVTLDWLRQLLGLPEPLHGHIEDTASSGLITALAAARAAAPDRRVVVCSEHTHSSTIEGGAPARARGSRDAGRRGLRAAGRRARPHRRLRRRRDGRDDVVDRRRSRRRDRRPRCADGGRLAPRRRRLRRGAPPSARSCATTSPAGSGPTRSASTRTSGCSRRWTARRSSAGAPTTSGARSASCPSTCA